MTERIDILVAGKNQASAVAKEVLTDYRAMSSGIQSMGSSSTGAIDSIAGSLGGLGNILAGGAILKGIQAIGGAIDDLSRRGAIFEQLGSVLNSYAESVGQTAQAFVDAGQKASAGTISDFDLILNANRSIQFEVAKTSDQYAKLIELATALGRAQGVSDTDALGFLTSGIARESKLILDNLGLIIDIDEATSAYASTLGKTADDLSTAERKQAILNEAFEQGRVAIEANRVAVDSAATRFERMDAAIQNSKDALGALFAPAVAVVAENLAKAAQGAAEQIQVIGRDLSLSDAIGEINSLRVVVDKLDEGLVRLNSDRGTEFEDDEKRFEVIVRRREAQKELTRLTDLYFNALRELYPATEQAFNPTSIEEQTKATRELALARAELANAVNDAPVDIRQSARRLIRTGDDDDGVRQRVLTLKGSFEEIEKLQDAARKSIQSNAIKASDIIGGDAAFDLGTQQIKEFESKVQELFSQNLSDEISTEQLLFQLQALPSQVTDIFTQVQAAGKDGGEKLRADLANLINLEDVFRSGGNDAAADVLAGKIKGLQSVLSIVAPAAQGAATGLGALGNAAVTADSQLASIVTNAGGAGSAAAGLGVDSNNAAMDVNNLTSALAAAPPALAAAGSAMIAAGMDAATAASLVAGLTAEFNQLAGAQAGARRAIIQRAAGVADIVGPAKALALANQEIANADKAYKGLEAGLLAAGDGSVEFEFDLAMLNNTTVSTFDAIEEADRKANQLAKSGLSAASKAANQAEKDFESLKGQVAGVLSGALNLDVGVDTEKILGREDAINEDARRLADVAVKGFDSPWASYLADKFPDTIGAAFEGADPKKAAAQLLRDFEDGLRPELLDKEAAKERVRRALVGDANMAALASEIAAELSAEFGGKISLGEIQATAGATLGVSGAETEQLTQALTGAASGVQQQLSGLGSSVKNGIIAALDGLGAAVTGALDKQFRSEGNLKTMREAGAVNGQAWGGGFLATVGDNIPKKLAEILAEIVTPLVQGNLNRDATLQGAN